MKQIISEGERERRARQSAQANAEKRAFDIAGFCQRYGVGKSKTYEEIRLGRLRVRKCGRKTLITEDDAEYWLENLPTAPAAGA
jgi:excisionase family DNA binding protein